MNRRKGFTIIELLVIITIVFLLAAALMPMLAHMARESKTTKCLMNLKQWCNIMQTYTNNNDGCFHGAHVGKTAWVNVYRSDYEKQPEIRCCPEATYPVSKGGKFPFAAWGLLTVKPYGYKDGDYGSYGENGWIESDNEYSGKGQYWKIANVKGASNVPMFLECMWLGAFVNPVGDNAVEAPRSSGGNDGRGMIDRYMMDRHSGYAGSAFLDFSARKVGMKELFRLKWHRKYDTNKWYELQKAKGWPDWLKNYKEY